MKKTSDDLLQFIACLLTALIAFCAVSAHAQVVPIWTTKGGSGIDLTAPGPIGSTTPSTGAFTTLSATSTVSGAGFTSFMASPPAIGGTAASTVQGTTITASTAFSVPVASANPPGLFFTGDGTTGWYRSQANVWAWSDQGTGKFVFSGSTFAAFSSGIIGFLSGAVGTGTDVNLVRDAADTLAQKRTTNAQMYRWYFSTTGPVYWMVTARAAGALYTASGGAAQVSYAQTTAPTCTTNCGSPGNVCVGTDTAMVCTMGTTPASGFVIVFNGTWPAAPSCIVQSALTSMITGKKPIAVQTSTTQITVTTDGTAPATSDKYSIICLGVS